MLRKFDVVIPVGPKDRFFFQHCVNGVKKNIIGVRNIYLLTCDPTISFKDCITIDEHNFPFSKADIQSLLGATINTTNPEDDRSGWYLQQLLKLYISFVVNGILDDYLVVDADTVFQKPTTFFEDDLPLYNYTPYIKYNYIEHMRALHPMLQQATEMSGICHHMMFQISVLRRLFTVVEKYHKMPFYCAFLMAIKPANIFAGASEYEIYFNFLFLSGDISFKIRHLKWRNADEIASENDVYVSHHWYIRKETYLHNETINNDIKT